MSEISKTVADFMRKMAEDAENGKPQNYDEFLKKSQDLFANAEKYHQDILNRTRRANEEAAEHFAQMHKNSESLTVSGEAWNSMCNGNRLWLCYLIYSRLPAQIQEQFWPYLYEAAHDWAEKDKDEDERIDYKARFYEERNGDCDPTVVFRGSVPGSQGLFEGTAVYIRVRLFWKTVYTHTFPLGDDEESKHVRRNYNYYNEVLLDESGLIQLPLSKEMKDADMAEIKSSGRMNLFHYLIYIPYHITCVLAAKKHGKCWATNIAQAFGERTAHYDKAKKFGWNMALRVDAENAEIIKKYGKGQRKKKLHCSGHSLGGGLAVAAARSAQTACPNLDVSANIYNAAGVHPNTVKGLRYASFFSDSVNDEILTTAQTYPEKLPFLKAILLMAGIHRLPEAGIPANHAALHPCPVMDDMPGGEGHSDRYQPLKRGEHLPILWPIEKQTLIRDQQFPEITRLNKMLSDSVNVKSFVEKLMSYIYHSYGDEIARQVPANLGLKDDTETFWSLMFQSYVKKIMDSEGADLKKLIMAAADYHGMDVVAQSIFLGEDWNKKEDYSKK